MRNRQLAPLLLAIVLAVTGAAAVLVSVPGAPAAAASGVPEPVAAYGNATAIDVSFGGSPVGVTPTPSGDGYWLVNRAGEVGAYGNATHAGDLSTLREQGAAIGPAHVADVEGTVTGGGYWLLDEVGGIFSFGDASFLGSVPGLRAEGVPVGPAAVVDLAPTPSGEGYWVLDGVGGVFSFGDASFLGSVPALRDAGVAIDLAGVVAIEPTPSGEGYWVLDTAGGVFAFGDAGFHGSLPGLRASGVPVDPVGATDFRRTASGDGYWILNADGGVFTFGDAPFHGSAAELPGRATGLAPSAGDGGYWIALARGVEAPPLPAGSGTGRRVVYCNSCQRVWLVESDGTVARSYPVSGRRGVPSAGTYQVFSKSRVSTDESGSLRLDYMTRFAHGRTLAIGFHGIPINRSTGQPIQSNEELGEARSAGCVRQAQEDAAFLWDWAPIGTKVVVTP